MKRAACLALAVVAAGCGGGSDRLSKSRYEEKLHKAFTAAFARVTNPDVTPGSVATSYRTIATSLKSVHPPANVQALHVKLVAGASAQAAVLQELAARVKGKPRAVRDRILAEFDASSVPGQREFDSAVAELEAKGYEFRPSAGT
jgi:hypothetical protein